MESRRSVEGFEYRWPVLRSRALSTGGLFSCPGVVDVTLPVGPPEPSRPCSISSAARIPRDVTRTPAEEALTNAGSRGRRAPADGTDPAPLGAAAASWPPPRAPARCPDCDRHGN